MKKAILITFLSFTVICANAIAQQVKKVDTAKKAETVKKHETPKKPEFSVNPDKLYHITLDLTDYQISALTGTSAGIVKYNGNLNGQQIQNVEEEAKDICKEIRREQNVQVKADYDKFVADTAKVKPVDKKKKK